MWFESLMSADIVVTDADATVARLHERLGIPRRPPRVVTLPSTGWTASFSSVSEPAYGPTALETLNRATVTAAERRSLDEVGDLVNAYLASQPDGRPFKSHCTPVTVTDVDALIEHLNRKGVPYRLNMGKNVWLGISQEDPPRYDPAVDGGLLLEFLPHGALEVQPIPADLPAGSLVRVTARSFLVADADDTLAALRASLDWPSEGDLDDIRRPRHRSVVIRPRNPLSGVLELLQPTCDHGRVAEDLRRFGPGPYAVRIGVNGLEAKLHDLAARGTRWTAIDPGPSGRPRVLVDRTQLDGLILELEDIDV